jgi:hypothetical protein
VSFPFGLKTGAGGQPNSGLFVLPCGKPVDEVSPGFNGQH